MTHTSIDKLDQDYLEGAIHTSLGAPYFNISDADVHHNFLGQDRSFNIFGRDVGAQLPTACGASGGGRG